MNEEIKKFNWVGRLVNNGGLRRKDVTVRITVKDEKAIYTGFTFRDGCYKLFTETEYIEVAPYKNRLFFKQSDVKHGLLLATNKSCKQDNKYAKLQNELCGLFVEFEGDYELKYDDFYELYYIERNDD